MEHTFLFKEGLWVVRGFYFDENDNGIHVEGKARVTHSENLWIKDGYMKLLAEDGFEIKNKHEIIPFKKDFTTWKSSNPTLGTLRGRYMIIDDTILSIFMSEDNQYTGIESNIQVSTNVYKCRGFTFKGNEKLSSWATELVYT